jgi:hypothetical protein
MRDAANAADLSDLFRTFLDAEERVSVARNSLVDLAEGKMPSWRSRIAAGSGYDQLDFSLLKSSAAAPKKEELDSSGESRALRGHNWVGR